MEQKAVIVLSRDLPSGLQANIAAVLGMSLGYYQPNLIGDFVITEDKKRIAGITTIPVPILTADEADLQRIFVDSEDFILAIPFGVPL